MFDPGSTQGRGKDRRFQDGGQEAAASFGAGTSPSTSSGFSSFSAASTRSSSVPALHSHSHFHSQSGGGSVSGRRGMSPSSSSSSLAALGPPSPAGPPSAASAVFAAVRKGSVRDLDAAIAALKRGGSGTPSYGASNPTGNGNSSGSSLNFGPGTGGSHTGNQTSSSGCQGGSAAASAGVLLLGAGAGAGSSTASAVDMRNPLGVTPLHVAVWRNHLPCVQRLLDAGADPDIRDPESGWSSLHRAFHFGHWAAAGLLLAAGASLVLQDAKGRTPLELIVAFRQDTSPCGLPTNTERAGRAEAPGEEKREVFSEVFSWGNGANYQLGTGAAGIQKVPGRLDSLQDCKVVAVASARFHSAAVTSTGELYTWGFGRGGRLGHPDFDVHSGQVAVIVPLKVSAGLNGRAVHAVAAAKHHTVIATTAGEVFTWGSNREGRLGYALPDTQPTPRKVASIRACVVAVAASNKHSAAVTDCGEVFTWGCNAHGQLGYGATSTGSNSNPRAVLDHLKGRQLVAVSAAKRHTIVLTADGEVWTWGHKMVIPRRVKIERDTRKAAGTPPLRFHRQEKLHIVSIAAGFLQSSVVSADGLVFVWASQDPLLKCQQLPSLNNEAAVSVSAGKYRTAVVTAGGKVFVWDSKDPRTVPQGPNPLAGSSLLGKVALGTSPGTPAPGAGSGQLAGGLSSRDREGGLERNGMSGSFNSGPGSSSGGRGGAHEDATLIASLSVPTPTQVPGLLHATAIAVGELHSVALSHVPEPKFSFSGPATPLPLHSSPWRKHASAGGMPRGEPDLPAGSGGAGGEGAGLSGDGEEEEEAVQGSSQGGSGHSLLRELLSFSSPSKTVALSLRPSSSSSPAPSPGESGAGDLPSNTGPVRPLKELCEAVVARSVVELRNAVQVLEIAESLQVPHLLSFCQELVLRNLDIIAMSAPQQLAQCRSSVLSELERLVHGAGTGTGTSEGGSASGPSSSSWRDRPGQDKVTNRALVQRWVGRRLPTPSAPHAPELEEEVSDSVLLRAPWEDGEDPVGAGMEWRREALGEEEEAAERQRQRRLPTHGNPVRRCSSSPESMNLLVASGPSPYSSGAEDEGQGRARQRGPSSQRRLWRGQGQGGSPSGLGREGSGLFGRGNGGGLLEGLREGEEDEERLLVSKQVRALKKKLQQIAVLEQRRGEGSSLDAQQLAKLRSKTEVEASLAVLATGGTLEEAAAAGEAAAAAAAKPVWGMDEARHQQYQYSRDGPGETHGTPYERARGTGAGSRRQKQKKGKDKRSGVGGHGQPDAGHSQHVPQFKEYKEMASEGGAGKLSSGVSLQDLVHIEETAKDEWLATGEAADTRPEAAVPRQESLPRGSAEALKSSAAGTQGKQEPGPGSQVGEVLKGPGTESARAAGGSTAVGPAENSGGAGLGGSGRKKGRKGGLSLFLSGALDMPPEPRQPPAGTHDADLSGVPAGTASKAVAPAPAWGRQGPGPAAPLMSLKDIQREQTSRPAPQPQMGHPTSQPQATGHVPNTSNSSSSSLACPTPPVKSSPWAHHTGAGSPATVLTPSTPSSVSSSTSSFLSSPAPPHASARAGMPVRASPIGLAAVLESDRTRGAGAGAGAGVGAVGGTLQPRSQPSAHGAAGMGTPVFQGAHDGGLRGKALGTPEAGKGSGRGPTAVAFASQPQLQVQGRSVTASGSGSGQLGGFAAKGSAVGGASVKGGEHERAVAGQQGTGEETPTVGSLKLSLYELLQHSQQQQQQQQQQALSGPVAVSEAQPGSSQPGWALQGTGGCSRSLEDDAANAWGKAPTPAWGRSGTTSRAPSAAATAGAVPPGPGTSPSTLSLRDIQLQQERQSMERRAVFGQSGGPGASASVAVPSSSSSASGPGMAASPPVVGNRWYRGAVEEGPRTSSIRCILKEEQAMKEMRALFGASNVRLLVPQSGGSLERTR